MKTQNTIPKQTIGISYSLDFLHNLQIGSKIAFEVHGKI